MKITCMLLLFLFSFNFSSDKDAYLKTTAEIKKIEIKRSGRVIKEIATVSFTTQIGKKIETVVELVRIPYFGSFKSVGDKITINYNKETPALVTTNIGGFIQKYGMYILIVLGIFFSVRSYKKAIKYNQTI